MWCLQAPPQQAKSGDEMQAGQLREMLRRDADAGASADETGATSRPLAEEADDIATDRGEFTDRRSKQCGD